MINKLPSPKTKKAAPQKGRGYGRRGGHTVGRGTKGQKSRSGYSRPRPGFEGGQMPLSRRLPKSRGESNKSRGRGFAISKVVHFELKLSEVAAKVEGNKVDNETLLEAGLLRPISKKISVKILFDKDIDKKLQVEGVQVSMTAREAITKAGGTVE